jgi:hypothetical protein
MKGQDSLKLTEFITSLLSLIVAVTIMTVENVNLSFNERMMVGVYFLSISGICVFFLCRRRNRELKEVKIKK